MLFQPDKKPYCPVPHKNSTPYTTVSFFLTQLCFQSSDYFVKIFNKGLFPAFTTYNILITFFLCLEQMFPSHSGIKAQSDL